MTYQFDSETAAAYGVEEAVFIAMLRFWIAKNEANGRHFHDGRYWTYNSIRAMEKLFPFWSRRQIERIVKKLREEGVVLTANYSKAGNDRTLFYALDEGRLSIPPDGAGVSPNGDTPLSRNGDNLSPNGEMINEQLITQLEEEGISANKQGNKPENRLTARQVMERYNELCPSLNPCIRLTDRRAKAVRSLFQKGFTPEQLTDAFRAAQASGFCTGANSRGWRADFDWLLNEGNLVKVLEGKYSGGRIAAPVQETGGRKWLR